MDSTRTVSRRLMAIMLALVLAATVMVCGCSGGDGGGSDAGSGAGAVSSSARTYQLKKGTVAGSNLSADRVTEMRDEGADILLALEDDGSFTLNLYGSEQTGTWKLDDDSDTEGSASTDVTSYMLEMDGDDSVTLISEDGSYDMQFEAIDADTYTASAEAMADLLIQPGCYRFVEGVYHASDDHEEGEAWDPSDIEEGYNIYLQLNEDGSFAESWRWPNSGSGTWEVGDVVNGGTLTYVDEDGNASDAKIALVREGDNIVYTSYYDDETPYYSITLEPISQEDYDAGIATMNALNDEKAAKIAGYYIFDYYTFGSNYFTQSDFPDLIVALYLGEDGSVTGKLVQITSFDSSTGIAGVASVTYDDENVGTWEMQSYGIQVNSDEYSTWMGTSEDDEGNVTNIYAWFGDDVVGLKRVDEDTYNSYYN